MKIKIVINTNNRIKSVFADDKTNQFIIGDVEIKKGVSTFIQSAIKLIKNWPEKIVAEEGQSLSNYYIIAYEDGTESKQIVAKGKFPNNFYKLSDLIFSYEDPILYKTQKNEFINYQKEGL